MGNFHEAPTTRRTPWIMKNRIKPDFEWQTDIDEARRLLGLSAFLGIILPKMPAEYIGMEALVSYFSRKMGYNKYLVREGVHILMGEGAVRIEQTDHIKRIGFNTDKGKELLSARVDWMINQLTEERIKEEWNYGGSSRGDSHYTFNQIRAWELHHRKKNDWENVAKDIIARRG